MALGGGRQPPGAINDEQLYGGEMVEKEKQSCAVERGETEEVKRVSNRLKWVACLPPGAMVISGPRLLPSTTSEFVVLP